MGSGNPRGHSEIASELLLRHATARPFNTPLDKKNSDTMVAGARQLVHSESNRCRSRTSSRRMVWTVGATRSSCDKTVSSRERLAKNR